MKSVPKNISRYFAVIGRRGGIRSRRILSSDDARNMVGLREARRAYRRFHSRCFWYMPQDMVIKASDIPEIVRGLRKNGGRQGFILASKLCR